LELQHKEPEELPMQARFARVQPANGNYEIPNAAGCKIESSKLRTTEIVADFAR